LSLFNEKKEIFKMPGTELIGFSLLILAIVGLIIWGRVKGSSKEKALKNLLTNAGFVPCNEEKKTLAEKVTFLENNSEYTYSVRKPMKVSHGDSHVYFYTKDRRRSGDLHVSEDFLLPVNRKTSLPFQIYLKPNFLKEGMATNLLRSVTTAGWDSQPDDLVKIELPADLQKSNILGAMGPKNYSFYDLFDSDTLSLLVHGADYDVFTIRCRENLCSIESPLVVQKKDYEKMWSFAQLLIRQGL
jgi:hypothetical protein